MVDQVLADNAHKMSRRNTTLFIGKNSRSMTNIDDDEEHERISLLSAVSLNVENDTSGKFF